MTTEITIPVSKVSRGINLDVVDLLPADAADEMVAAFVSAWEASPALRYAVQYGLTQSVNDAHAAMKLSDNSPDAIVAVAEKKLEAILTGSVSRGGGGATRNPLETEIRKLATQSVKAAIKRSGLKVADIDKEKVADLIQTTIDQNREGLEATAKKLLAEKAAAQVTVNISGLDLSGDSDDATETE